MYVYLLIIFIVILIVYFSYYYCNNYNIYQGILIRPVKRREINELVDLHHGIFPIQYSRTTILRLATDSKCITRAAYVNGKMVGVITSELKKGNKLYIFSFGVLKEYRNKGIGTLLMMELLNLELTRNIRIVHLHMQSTNTIAIKYYKRFGFEIVDTINNFYYSLEDKTAHLMQLKIR